MTALLITGANGRVARLLRRAPLDKALWSQRGSGADLDWAPLDGPQALVDYCARHGKPQALCMLAGVTPGPGARLEDNVALGRAAVEAASAVGIGRVLLASSSAVYGHGRAQPWSEDDDSRPANPYGEAKLAMERACAAQGVTMLRIGNVAGADALLTNPRRPLLLDQFADGTGPRRSYIGPQTLARLLQRLAQVPALPPVLNIGTPRPVDMADLAVAAGLPVERQLAPPGAIAALTLDTTQLEQLFPFADTDSAPETMIAEWRACKEPS
ncbi:NAD-dependent epimerase/dehydratase family protein [Rhodobacter sp. NTK016B]|uniref:NAD-dependent epimerase/dehydratase family protein n=1 Tax=Rhodobacter sp. NTK016B TaxID=2759676 RepID=UPI001A8EE1D8|nr:NAD-dependent epimerase/dehydratase family protein [Rhodobacter sp. NTK016B]MBN8294095.1 NAD-dependent epimerase/dehydratase family protein [Rhodobacter sp. NTK016B]